MDGAELMGRVLKVNVAKPMSMSKYKAGRGERARELAILRARAPRGGFVALQCASPLFCTQRKLFSHAVVCLPG
jgi:hypothetical protein